MWFDMTSLCVVDDVEVVRKLTSTVTSQLVKRMHQLGVRPQTKRMQVIRGLPAGVNMLLCP